MPCLVKTNRVFIQNGNPENLKLLPSGIDQEHEEPYKPDRGQYFLVVHHFPTIASITEDSNTPKLFDDQTAGNAGVPQTATISGLAWASSQALTFTFNVANTDQVTPIQWAVELIQ